MDEQKVRLEYRTPVPAEAEGVGTDPAWSGGLAAVSMACAVGQIVGFVWRDPILLLCGGLVVPVLGILLAVFGMAAGAARMRLVFGIALLMNAGAMGVFFWVTGGRL